MSIEDVIAASVVRPVYIGWFDFKDDPIRGWTGPGVLVPTGTGDSDLDSETFDSVAGAIDISDFTEQGGLGGPITITFSAGEMDDEDIVLQLVGDRRAFQGRTVRIWLAFLNAAESAILPEIEPLFTGIMVSAETSRQPGQPATIAITCDQDTQKARTRAVRLIDHQVYYPGDTASTYMNDLARGPISGSERAPPASAWPGFSPPPATPGGGRYVPWKR